ncbi:hypothetical protein EIKCOROL_01538 [Eikenella corrodens ATCC 23834]|uniref:Uncharacterized protein n=1 Tax=Eikenella corrodens ATCC 23834 TaxID=546274 RepID=C0DVZ2_EIKCO|nr:hypothetical protein EIKCOROL_01538 [Eikenella corrodens ATCC 23834]
MDWKGILNNDNLIFSIKISCLYSIGWVIFRFGLPQCCGGRLS